MTKTEDALNDLAEAIRNAGRGQIKVQTVWATATEVDWDNKTMTATGVVDDLPFYNVHLGLGSSFRKPKIGTTCLIGIIENQEASTFLIDAEDIEEISFKTEGGKLVLNDAGIVMNEGKNGGLVNWPKALAELNKTKAVVDQISNLLQNWVVAPSDGGAALQTAAKLVLATLKTGNYSNLEDTKVKH